MATKPVNFRKGDDGLAALVSKNCVKGYPFTVKGDGVCVPDG